MAWRRYLVVDPDGVTVNNQFYAYNTMADIPIEWAEQLVTAGRIR